MLCFSMSEAEEGSSNKCEKTEDREIPPSKQM